MHNLKCGRAKSSAEAELIWSELIIFRSVCDSHGLIIKWTQHIGVLTLAGMARVVEGNYGNNSKKRVVGISVFIVFGKIWLQFTFLFLWAQTKQMRAYVILWHNYD